MESKYSTKEEVAHALDLVLTGLISQAHPSDIPEIVEALCVALVEFNDNLILDKKKENKNG